MPILIKGMEMPKSCGECPFGRDEDAQYYACDLSEWSYVNPDGRELRDDCPLVELPPHGRLIDAEWLTEHMKNKYENGPFGWNPDEFDVLAVIDDAPTIIEAEEEKE